MNLLQENINRIRTLMNLSEGVAVFDSNEKNLINQFIDFTKKELNIKNDVDVTFQTDKDGIETTAVYRYSNNGDTDDSEIKVYTKDRALQDILRSFAHEMVHHHQNENNELEGDIPYAGGKIEDEANALAGEILKKFGEIHPEIYGPNESELTEDDEGGESSSTPSSPPPSSPSGGSGGGDSSSTNANVSAWESGAIRGPANPIANTVWPTNQQPSRGKANPIDNTTWESGASRGKANPLT